MRPINNFEREILLRIVGFYNQSKIPNLALLLDSHLENKFILLNYHNNTAEIRTSSSIPIQDIMKNARVLTMNIVTTVNLLKYLEENGYLTLFLEFPGEKKPETFGQLAIKEGNASSLIYDSVIVSLLLDYSFKSILVGQALIDLVNNGFRTQEQLRADRESVINMRNLRIAVIALLISTVLSFFEIYNGCQEVKYGKLQVEQEQAVKLNADQIKSFEEKMKIDKYYLDSGFNLLSEIKKLQEKLNAKNRSR